MGRCRQPRRAGKLGDKIAVDACPIKREGSRCNDSQSKRNRGNRRQPRAALCEAGLVEGRKRVIEQNALAQPGFAQRGNCGKHSGECGNCAKPLQSSCGRCQQVRFVECFPENLSGGKPHRLKWGFQEESATTARRRRCSGNRGGSVGGCPMRSLAELGLQGGVLFRDLLDESVLELLQAFLERRIAQCQDLDGK